MEKCVTEGPYTVTLSRAGTTLHVGRCDTEEEAVRDAKVSYAVCTEADMVEVHDAAGKPVFVWPRRACEQCGGLRGRFVSGFRWEPCECVEAVQA